MDSACGHNIVRCTKECMWCMLIKAGEVCDLFSAVSCVWAGCVCEFCCCDCRSAPEGVSVIGSNQDQKQRGQAHARPGRATKAREPAKLDTPTRPPPSSLSSLSSHLPPEHVCTRRTVARRDRCVPSPALPTFPASIPAYAPAGRRAFSRSAARQNYEATIQNLLIHKDTKVLCQGITGKTVGHRRCGVAEQ